jgi:hypothetical protein
MKTWRRTETGLTATYGVPNKPLVLTARDCTKDRRPAHGGSTSANRWAASDGGRAPSFRSKMCAANG